MRRESKRLASLVALAAAFGACSLGTSVAQAQECDNVPSNDTPGEQVCGVNSTVQAGVPFQGTVAKYQDLTNCGGYEPVNGTIDPDTAGPGTASPTSTGAIFQNVDGACTNNTAAYARIRPDTPITWTTPGVYTLTTSFFYSGPFCGEGACPRSATSQITVLGNADVSVTKAGPSQVTQGEQFTYTLTAHNAGPYPATNTTVTDALPPGLTVLAVSPGCTFSAPADENTSSGTVVCDAGTLPANSDLTFDIVVRANRGGTFNNTATITTANPDPNGANNTSNTQTTTSTGCTRTITGYYPGSLTVASGQVLCLAPGSVVGGSITVQPGGSLISDGATVRGAITTNGAQVVELCGSTVQGAVRITNTNGPVRVGDDDGEGHDCAGNTLRSSLTVTYNHGAVDIYNNDIAGTTTVNYNQNINGSALYPDDAAPEIKSNRIGGSLGCVGNVPPPTNEGGPNTTVGAKTGQCATL